MYELSEEEQILLPRKPKLRQSSRRKVLEYNPSHGLGYYTTVRDINELHHIENIGTTEVTRAVRHEDRFFRTFYHTILRYLKNKFRKPCAYLCDIWLLLMLVAFICACLCFTINECIKEGLKIRHYLLSIVASKSAKYAVWMMLTVFPIWFATKFVQIVAPQSAGSGIPELKAIIKGIEVKNFLTVECLFAKLVGLLAVLAVSFPLGKEATFIHIAAILAHQLNTKSSKSDVFTSELKQRDILVSASAIGLASAMISPIGGFLFVIELNSIYFSIRHYWHGFFGSIISVVIISFLYSSFYDIPNIMPYYASKFKVEFSSYDGRELFLYLLLGIICGLGGSLFVFIKKKYALFLKQNSSVPNCIRKYCCPYSILISACIATLTFPQGLGKYLAVEIDSHQQVEELFSNFSWTKENYTAHERNILNNWVVDENPFVCVGSLAIYTFIFSIAASTMAIPGGLLTPVIKIGACIGRVLGEIVNFYWMPIYPGAFAIAGAAAFSGSVTHMVSMAIIAFEITGHITNILPIMISVITAISIAFLLQLSLHDTDMLLKGLPYLPNLMTCGSKLQRIYVEDFMIKDVKYIWNGMSYHNLQKVLQRNKQIDQFPLVDHETMVLLGSIQREELMNVIERQIGHAKRLCEAENWLKLTGSSPNSGKYGSFEKTYGSPRRVMTMSPVQKQQWRSQKLVQSVNFFENEVVIDPAPFQLVEGTCLFQVHSLFVMVGVHLAYVTQVGQLVGVVGLRDLRTAMESAKNDESQELHESFEVETVTDIE